MEIASFILTAISTITAVISVIIAVSAKDEVKELKNKIIGNGNVQNPGKININNKGDNQGIIAGVNTSEIRK